MGCSCNTPIAGLMTKREVRIQLLADLDLPPPARSGASAPVLGSIGLEALRLRPGCGRALEQRGAPLA
jgi:precorrin-6Y C5,15-methyltransferase (decarboxylating)